MFEKEFKKIMKDIEELKKEAKNGKYGVKNLDNKAQAVMSVLQRLAENDIDDSFMYCDEGTLISSATPQDLMMFVCCTLKAILMKTDKTKKELFEMLESSMGPVNDAGEFNEEKAEEQLYKDNIEKIKNMDKSKIEKYIKEIAKDLDIDL